MASGLAVVAYDYAAAEIFIKHQENGVLVPYGDQQQFVDSAVAASLNLLTIRRLGMEAGKAVQGYAWDGVCDTFANYLSQARSQSKPTSQTSQAA